MDNLHYSSLIILLGEFAPHVDLEICAYGSGVHRDGWYRVVSKKPGELDFEIRLNTFERWPTEYQEKVYYLVSYLKKCNDDEKAKIATSPKIEILNDEQMFNVVSELLSDYCRDFRDNAVVAKRVLECYRKMNCDFNEVKKNCIPITREATSFFVAYNLASDCINDQSEVFNAVQQLFGGGENGFMPAMIQASMVQSLKRVGYSEESIKTMWTQNKPLPGKKNEERE